MSYRERGVVHAIEMDATNTLDIAIGDIVSVLATGKAKRTDTRDGVSYYPAVEPSTADCNVVSAQVTGVAKVRVKDGETIVAGDVVIVDAAEATVLAGVVGDKTLPIYIGIAMEPSDGQFVPVLLGR